MPLMNSFYGGRQGASFVIVKNYIDVLSMVTDFSQGNDFTEVKFDEYVLINNPYKNHPDNGKIFRRGYDYASNRILDSVTLLCDNEGNPYPVENVSYQNVKDNDQFLKKSIPAYGAEYIGSIIGPAGNAPLLSVVPYGVAQEKSSNFKEKKVKGSFNPISDTYGVYDPIGKKWSENENANPGLIPGKYEQNNEIKYNDSIQWYSTSIRNDKYGEDTQAFIGFKFPYLVTQMQTSQVEPYNTNGNIADMSDIFRAPDDDGSHPYYNKWHLNIPKGVKGDTFKNLKVTTYLKYQESSNNSNDKTALYELYKNEENVWQEEQLLGGDVINYDFFKTRYGFEDSQLQENQQYVPRKLYDLLEDKQILVYEVINYDNKKEGQRKYYFLGDYNQIENVELDEEKGYINISFTNQNDKQLGPLKWIKNIKLFAGHWEDQIGEDGNPVYERNEEGDFIYKTDPDGNPINETDGEGNPVYERDEEGNIVYEKDEEENLIYEKDEEGNLIYDENENPIPIPVIQKARVKKQKWINLDGTSELEDEDKDLGIQNGTLVIHYNDSEKDQVFNIPWIDKVRFDKYSGKLYYGIVGQDEADIEIADNLYSIFDIVQNDNQLKIVYNHTVDGTEKGEKASKTFPLKSISKIVFLKKSKENTEGNEDTTGEEEEEEINNVFPIFAREAPVEGETRGKIKYDDNNNPIYESFVQNEDGLYQTTDPNSDDTKKQILVGIVVFYTDGDHELITGQRTYDELITQDNNQIRGKITEEIGGGFDYLENFGFETEDVSDVTDVPNAIYYKTLKNEQTKVKLTYPVSLYYDQNTGLVKYMNSQKEEKEVGQLPVVESIDIGDNLDVYVKMNHPAPYFQNIDPQHTSHDNEHQYTNDTCWYKIGNLIQEGLTFAGVRQVFLFQDLKQFADALDESSQVYSIWSKWPTEAISAEEVATTLNAIYPQGIVQRSNNAQETSEETGQEESGTNTGQNEGGTDSGQNEGGTDSGSDSTEPSSDNTDTEGQGNTDTQDSSTTEETVIPDNTNYAALLFVAVKENENAPSDFYAFSYTPLIDSSELIVAGRWFYVGSIGDLGDTDSIFQISETGVKNSTSTDETGLEGETSNPAVMFKTPKDIYEITSALTLSNHMKEIREGSSYKTVIKVSSRLTSSQTIQVRMGENIQTVVATFNSSTTTFPYEVSIDKVTGPISIVKI